ncbi:MAG: Pr6Pr family membrane protein [Bifidobacteriaceae bacterium]|jgi:hypothetical protein|nr:Pr6Pr family membrane protein [Bifidobacteriaceae bacterium]
MRIFKQFFVAVFRLAVAFFAIAGTYEAWTGAIPSKWVFFTIQSNIAVGIVFAWAGLATLLRGVQPPAWLKGCLTLYILITGLVANFILHIQAGAPYVLGISTTLMVHAIVPIGAAIDFLLFDSHRRFKWHYAFSWLIYFPLYLGFVLLRANFYPNSGPGHDNLPKSPYPYNFIDVQQIGWAQLGINIVIYLAAFLVLGLIIVGLDRALPAKALVSTARTGR